LLVWAGSRWPGAARHNEPAESIKIGYATFFDHVHTPELLRARTAQLFDWIADGRLRIRIGGEYALADAAQAHADMKSRKTTGKLLLVP
jgi:NADPH2:quinone reductase